MRDGLNLLRVFKVPVSYEKEFFLFQTFQNRKPEGLTLTHLQFLAII